LRRNQPLRTAAKISNSEKSVFFVSGKRAFFGNGYILDG